MPVIVRRFEKEEWRIYRDLRLSALADSPDSFGSTYEREAARSDAEWQSRLIDGVIDTGQIPLVALMKELPVGLAWGRRDRDDPTLAHLFQVWVAPKHRGQGIGRQLTEAVISWAREIGVRTIRLGVTAGHPGAAQLYGRAGFVNAGETEPLRPGSSVRCQPMELTLDSAIQNRLV